MPVATSTLAAGLLIGGLATKTVMDSRKAARNQPAPLVLPEMPQYEKPDIGRAVRLQRARITGASGRAGTIKTGPSGITTPSTAKPKTLIGG